ncbi:hypothetical protein [Mycobacterium sp.]|uniref:hypothetical protein n=1 Tax=Mycobacterium sp. TaxID=1785 RepID=UPI003F9E5A94
MAGNGPSDDFNNQQTTKAAYGMDEAPSDTPPDQSPEHEGFQPAPWYRSPPLLIAWLVLVLILIALIVYGIGELMGGNEGTSPAPSSTTTTTTAPTTSTSEPPASTTTETPPPTSSEVPPPTQQQPTYQPTNPPTTKHHPHLPTLPPGIRLPF